jgi:hypothetical protein
MTAPPAMPPRQVEHEPGGVLPAPEQAGPASPVPTVPPAGALAGPEGRWTLDPRWRPGLERAAGAAELALASAGLAGSGVFAATLLHGRTALFWPSAAWLGAAIVVWAAAGALWWLAARVSGRPTPAGRWRASAWPQVALLPAAAAALAIYLDDGTNHLLTVHAPARQSLLAYGALLFGGGQAAYWLAAVARRVARRRPALDWARSGGWVAPVAFGVALAAYADASLYLQWVPTQTDLLVNLRGARELLAGGLPYNDHMPVWADRVHMLPATLVLLFGPLAALPDETAKLVFFLANQALWIGALALLVRRLVPGPARWAWLSGLLLFSATYWPWQEAIRFGQQDGLLVLLFAIAITSALDRRQVASGVALGLVFVVKPLSIWLPLIYVVHGRWRTLFIAGATALALAAATLPFTGVGPWWHFVRVEVPEMLPGTVRGTNIPLPSLHARLFVGRERLGDGDPAPTLGAISALNLAANALGLLVVARLALRRAGGPQREWLLDASLGLTLTLLLAPMAWQHYASWLAIAFAVLCLPLVWRPLPVPARLASGALAGLGFLLLGLEDARLLRLLTPVVERWPGAMSFYAAGLLGVLGALLVARFAAASAGEPAAA